MPWLGDRAARIAIVALTGYALLPIIRNTYVGIRGIDPAVLDVAHALGMTGWQRLVKVELPLAAGVILAGLRTATVICVGIATIAAAVGAGGLGEFHLPRRCFCRQSPCARRGHPSRAVGARR